MTLKADAVAIQEFIRELARKPWLGEARKAWPLHLYRIDDVRAAASILEASAIYSRERAKQLGVLVHDSASATVIDHSPDWCKSCVRLYFRPRTPTEYRSEGFRPTDQIELGAHRPMPVVFEFSAIPIVTDSRSVFTNGNAAKRECETGSDVEFLRSIPFEHVYHDSALTEAEKREIVFRRCAEVLVESELTLDHLTRVLCRSQAEYETLLSLLSQKARNRYARRIGISGVMHRKSWTFVESAELSDRQVTLRFNPSSRTPGPFRALLQINKLNGAPEGSWQEPSFWTNSDANCALTVRLHKLIAEYRAELTLDGNLAYLNEYRSDESPF